MTKEKTVEPSFSELYFKKFLNNNPHAEVSIEEESLIIDCPWAKNDAGLKADISDQEFIAEINKSIST